MILKIRCHVGLSLSDTSPMPCSPGCQGSKICVSIRATRISSRIEMPDHIWQMVPDIKFPLLYIRSAQCMILVLLFILQLDKAAFCTMFFLRMISSRLFFGLMALRFRVAILLGIHDLSFASSSLTRTILIILLFPGLGISPVEGVRDSRDRSVEVSNTGDTCLHSQIYNN
jgi:hypothetical protein